MAGDGKINLLQKIGETGSIQRAAAKMGMSYRHAWGFIKKMEERAGIRFIETKIGGKEGGGARLTSQGRDFLKRYFAFREGLDEYIENKFKKAFE